MRSRTSVIASVLLFGAGTFCATSGAQQRSRGADDAATHRTARWVEDYWRGWHFYEDPEVEEEQATPRKPEAAKPAAPSPAIPKRDDRPIELRMFEELQKKLEEERQIAIMRPTFENVRRYMETERRAYAKAHEFSDVASRVSLLLPSKSDQLGIRPTSMAGLLQYDEAKEAASTGKLHEIRDTHALFFVYRSDCPYCKTMSATLKRMQERFGLQIVPISVDGGPLPEFPQFRLDNGTAATLNVQSVPAMFLVEPRGGFVFPLGTGVHSESQLVERINLALDPKTTSLVPQASTALPAGQFSSALPR